MYFFDAATAASIDRLWGYAKPNQYFVASAGGAGSRSYMKFHIDKSSKKLSLCKVLTGFVICPRIKFGSVLGILKQICHTGLPAPIMSVARIPKNVVLVFVLSQ